MYIHTMCTTNTVKSNWLYRLHNMKQERKLCEPETTFSKSPLPIPFLIFLNPPFFTHFSVPYKTSNASRLHNALKIYCKFRIFLRFI